MCRERCVVSVARRHLDHARPPAPLITIVIIVRLCGVSPCYVSGVCFSRRIFLAAARPASIGAGFPSFVVNVTAHNGLCRPRPPYRDGWWLPHGRRNLSVRYDW